MLRLGSPGLAGKTWQTSIMAWVKSKGCYQKVYCYTGELNFNGSILQLPFLNESKRWVPFYYREKNGVKIMRSIDPRNLYQIEVQLPGGTYSHYDYIDRASWNEKTGELCSMVYSENLEGTRDTEQLSFTFPVLSGDECAASEASYLIDSFLILDLGPGAEVVYDYFAWKVSGAIIEPDDSCPSRGRTGTRPDLPRGNHKN
jgi:hypothetical protein